MLIIVLKCNLNQVILNEVHYHKCHRYHWQIPDQAKTTPARPILCRSQIRVEADIQWCKIVLQAQ